VSYIVLSQGYSLTTCPECGVSYAFYLKAELAAARRKALSDAADEWARLRDAADPEVDGDVETWLRNRAFPEVMNAAK